MIPVFIVCGKSPLGASGGGYSSYAYNLAKVLKKLKFKVYIVALEGSRTTALPFLPIHCYLFARRIRQICQKNSFKKVIVWGIGPWGLAGIFLKYWIKSDVIWLNHYFTSIKHEWKAATQALFIKDYGLLKLKYLLIYYTLVQLLSALERMVIFGCDIIITNYQSTEEILIKQFNVPRSKFKRCHFWVETYQRNGLQKDRKHFKLPKKFLLFMSRHDVRKGINFLLHAHKILLDQGYKIPLVIAGDGQMLKANRNLASKLGLNRWVKFLGFVNDPLPLMKKATIFCLPSIEEGAGALVVNEAMAQGLPIIATTCDGILEDLKHNHSAILVPKADPVALAAAILKLWNNPDFAKKLGENAKVRFDNQFNLRLMSQDIKKLIDRFL